MVLDGDKGSTKEMQLNNQSAQDERMRGRRKERTTRDDATMIWRML